MTEMIEILCVEDDGDTLFITALSLGLDPDFGVITARSGIEALNILEARGRKMDCILLDARMPGMSGPALMAAIHDLPGHASTPVIFLTASMRPADEAYYNALGARGMIAKPYDPLTLAKQVREMIKAP